MTTITRRGIMAAGAGMAWGGAARAQARWQAASPWVDGNFHVRNLRQFLGEAQQASEGGLDVRLYPGGTLVKASEIRRGLQAGRVQIGDFLLASEAELDPLLELDMLPMVARSLDDARRLAALTRPMIEQSLRRGGLTLLYLAPWPPPGLFSGFMVNALTDLSGTRIRSVTNVSARLANVLGALSARIEPEEVPQAFAARIATTMFASAPTGMDVEAWNFARFFTPLDWGYPKNAVCVQSRAWETLPPRRRAAVQEAAAAAEERAWGLAVSEQPVAQQRLAARGVTVRPAPPALVNDLARYARIMLEEWRSRAGEPGIRVLDALRAG